MAPIKVALVGPPRTGKSVLANFLADNVSAPVRGEYRPTKGCRSVLFAVTCLFLKSWVARLKRGDLQFSDRPAVLCLLPPAGT